MSSRHLGRNKGHCFHRLLREVHSVEDDREGFCRRIASVCTASASCSPHDRLAGTFFTAIRGGLRCTIRRGATTRIVFGEISGRGPFIKVAGFGKSCIAGSSIGVTGGCLSRLRLRHLGLLISSFLSFTRFRTLRVVPVGVRS